MSPASSDRRGQTPGEFHEKENLCALIVLVFMLSGCDATMVMVEKSWASAPERFIYQDGYLSTQYKANVDQVWLAGEKTVTDLKGQQDRKGPQNRRRID